MKWIAGAAAVAALARAASPPFSVSVETSWPAPPLLLEILEVAHDEDPRAYFPLLHVLSKHVSVMDSPTPEAVLERAQSLMDSHKLLAQPSQRATFNLGLGLHTAAPRIEAAYSAYSASIDEDALGVTNCSAWVDFRGKAYCDPDTLHDAVARGIDQKGYVPKPVTPSPFDRVRGGGTLQAVLYYSPTPESLPLLEYLDRRAANTASFTYSVRYRPTARDNDTRTKLAGYGVEMALKKTDYLVVDDRDMGADGGEKKQAPFSAFDASNPFAEALGDDPWSESAAALTTEETKKLGLAAASLIMGADDPMGAFVALTQDLPKYAAAVARNVEVSPDVRKRAFANGLNHPIGPAFFVNGRHVKETDVNAFNLLKLVRRERHLMKSLVSLGLSNKQAYELLSDNLIGEAATETNPMEGLVDARDDAEGGGVVLWLNDLENDAAYARWPDSLTSYLRPVHPGQLHFVRLNTFNAIVVVDFASATGLEAIAGAVNTLLQRQVPIRLGLVPMFDNLDSDAAKMAKVIYYVADKFGAKELPKFLISVIMASPATEPKTVSMAIVRDLYTEMARKRVAEAEDEGDEVSFLSFEDVLSSPELEKKLEMTQAYLNRLAATPRDGANGHVFVNGAYIPYSSQWTMGLQQVLTTQLGMLQEAISNLELTNSEDISTFFYSQPSTALSRNKFIVPSVEHELRAFSILDVFDGEAQVLAENFVYPRDKEARPSMSLWVVGDLDSSDGHVLLERALEHLAAGGAMSRLSFVHVPSVESASLPEPRLSTLLYQLVSRGADAAVTPSSVLELVKEVNRVRDNVVDTGRIAAESAGASGLAEEDTPLNAFTSEGWSAPDAARAADFWSRVGNLVAERLNIKSATAPYLLLNGRLVGPLTPNDFTQNDFGPLEEFEMRKRVEPVLNLLSTFVENLSRMPRDKYADLVSSSSSVMAAAYMPEGAEGIWVQTPSPRGRPFENLDEGEISFTTGNDDNALVRVAAIIDPVSQTAQKWSGLLKASCLGTWLSTIDRVSTKVWLDPNFDLKEFKVKRFYRSALRTSLSFDVDGHEVMPAPTFHDLPGSPIFTLAMEVSPSWVVSPKQSPLDLDNILLGNLYQPTNVLFDLKQLVVDGHAREGNNQPPRGLQLQLKDGSGHVVSDTQVMANVGYLQFKAPPGVYNLSIRPGRGQEVYELESAGADGWDSPPVNVSGTAIRLDSFDGMTLYPRFARRQGMAEADVLEVAPKSESVVESFVNKWVYHVEGANARAKSLLGLKEDKPASRHADINIFTVASGLLYERFASIMILSVMKHTNSSVKFWFIENFLSPTFLRFLPHLAKEYGFDYELVTYKWPSWLRAQTEKQRIIWAYKILFLDVLFPMDLDKVIFVDADQIVRTDMQELVDLDLEGHVYGYPPMGDDREEMEGFRFWKTGYWAQELRGKPYHISALYVVDLQRFRQLAAGDRLRGMYQALSADPNSLANLDQDLPNSMQRQLPIFTLDKDWLWCQTWCSDESLATAKTIDLCQNPLTKEPKLSRARQIPEWDVYDREIAAFAATLESDAGALAANVDDLASGPGGAGAQAGSAPKPGSEAEAHAEAEDENKHAKDEL